MGTGAGLWMLLALLVLLFALFGYLLLGFLNKTNGYVFKGKEADAFLIAVSLCICRNVEPMAAVEPLQRHLWGWRPGALPRVPHLLAGKTRLRWITKGDFLVFAGGVFVYVVLPSPSLWLRVCPGKSKGPVTRRAL